MYDFFGDIHRHDIELRALLTNMYYRAVNSVWQHANSRVMFFGGWGCCDPEQFETIQFAHTSVKNCDAIAVMSAHEPNDVAWATTGPKNPRESFRPLNDQNLNNSQSTQFLRFAGSPADMLLIEPTALDWDVALQEYADDA